MLLDELHSPSPLLLLGPKGDTHFTVLWRVVDWIGPDWVVFYVPTNTVYVIWEKDPTNSIKVLKVH